MELAVNFSVLAMRYPSMFPSTASYLFQHPKYKRLHGTDTHRLTEHPIMPHLLESISIEFLRKLVDACDDNALDEVTPHYPFDLILFSIKLIPLGFQPCSIRTTRHDADCGYL